LIIIAIDGPAATGKSTTAKIVAEKFEAEKCPRCWNYSLHIGEDKDYPELCPRCAAVVRELDNK